MKRTSLTVSCVLAGLLLFQAVPSFAWTWTANGGGQLDPLNLISDITFVSNDNITDTFTMNLSSSAPSINNINTLEAFNINIVNNNVSLQAAGTGINIFGTPVITGNVNLQNSVTNPLATTFIRNGNTLIWSVSDPILASLNLSGTSSIGLSGNATFVNFAPSGSSGGQIGASISTNDITPSPADVNTPTPIPAAAWLLGSGLMSLLGLRKKEA